MSTNVEQEKLFFEVLRDMRGVGKGGKRKIKLCTLKSAYSEFSTRFNRRKLPGAPINYTTFTRWYKSKVPELTRIHAEKGKKAARRSARNKTGTMEIDGFLMATEGDGYNEPVLLVNSVSFKKLKITPIHHFNVEQSTGAMHGYCTNYISGSERADFVGESIKQMIMVKPDWREKYGSQFDYPMYGRPSRFITDGHQAYLAGATNEVLNLGYIDSATTRTDSPNEKPFVEATNRIIKQKFTSKLDGSYDDEDEDLDFNAVDAFFTPPEHQVLFARYITDVFHQESVERLSGNSRYSQWNEEARIYGVTLPQRPQELLAFHGIFEFKTIVPATGIQKQVNGEQWVFNSDQLQDLRVRMEKMKNRLPEMRVVIKYTLVNMDFIQVKDPLQNKFFPVPVVTNNFRNQKKLSGYNSFVAPFAEEQTIPKLAKLTNAEIIANARSRKRMIDHYIRQRRSGNKKVAITLDEAARRDFQFARDLYKRGGAVNDDGLTVAYEDVVDPQDPPIDYDFTPDDDLDFDI